MSFEIKKIRSPQTCKIFSGLVCTFGLINGSSFSALHTDLLFGGSETISCDLEHFYTPVIRSFVLRSCKQEVLLVKVLLQEIIPRNLEIVMLPSRKENLPQIYPLDMSYVCGVYSKNFFISFLSFFSHFLLLFYQVCCVSLQYFPHRSLGASLQLSCLLILFINKKSCPLLIFFFVFHSFLRITR